MVCKHIVGGVGGYMLFGSVMGSDYYLVLSITMVYYVLLPPVTVAVFVSPVAQ